MYLLLIAFVTIFTTYYVYQNWKKEKEYKFYSQWDGTPKDTVVLHCFPRAANIVNASPFVLKVETWCRMANVKYIIDEVNAFGPKGKSPWITINGVHLADSQLIIEYLKKRFGVNLNSSYSDEQLAIGRAVRVMLEEHFFWCMPLWRFVWNGIRHQPFLGMNLPIYVRIFMNYTFKNQALAHGIGRHSKDDIIKMIKDDLRTASKLLGSKPYLLGSEPCEDDAAVFGQIAQAVWALPNSPYEKIINDELPNLRSYCVRMKEKFWPDWNDCLKKVQ